MTEDRLSKYTSLLDAASTGEADCLSGMSPGLRDPERSLLFAVLVDAITCKDGWWVAGHGGLGPFTFANVCEALGFDRMRLGTELLLAFAADAALRRPRRSVSVGMTAAGREGHRRRRARASA